MPDEPQEQEAVDALNAQIRGAAGHEPPRAPLPADASAVARAAEAAGFIDVSDAEGFLHGQEFADDAAANAAVAALAKSKPHLIGDVPTHDANGFRLPTPGTFGGGQRGGYGHRPESADDALRRALREARSAPGAADIDFGRSNWGWK